MPSFFRCEYLHVLCLVICYGVELGDDELQPNLEFFKDITEFL